MHSLIYLVGLVVVSSSCFRCSGWLALDRVGHQGADLTPDVLRWR